MEREILELRDLQSLVKGAIGTCFPERLWVKAEISSLKARLGSHCYLELSQSGPSGIVAKCRAVIWAGVFSRLYPYFKSVTGSDLCEGMTVLLQVQVTYSEVYGFSLNVVDIDPEYTLGAGELARRQTLERLEKEGLMTLQKELAIPTLPYRIAVISTSTGAGYRDFMEHLHKNEYGFVFSTELFPALVQGVEAPDSIAEAISEASQKPFDLIAILRGGGSKLDLSCFDEYVLARAIALCPIPVMTAVGHDQDYHIADMVACEYVKTPTALADYLVSLYAEEDERIGSYSLRLSRAFLGKIGDMQRQVETLYRRIPTAFGSKLSLSSQKLENIAHRIPSAIRNKIAFDEHRLETLGKRILVADPRIVLSRGYTLVASAQGKVIKSAANLSKGDNITLMFPDGTANAQII